jgi:hypothetical protein
MPDENPWVDDTLLEFCTFPAAKYDDRVDAASQALLWLQSQHRLFDPEFMRQIMEANARLTGARGAAAIR